MTVIKTLFHGKTLGQLLDRRRNNFDAIRLAAALLVVVSHSYAITGKAEPGLQATITLGSIGIFIFFAISGLLVAKSWEAHPRVGAFLGKRFLRIWPALAVVTIFSAFVIGPFMTFLSYSSYMNHPGTIRYLDQLSIIKTPDRLPGVFTHNPVGVVNGSLWTIPFETVAYLILVGLAFISLLKPTRRLILAILTFAVCCIAILSRHGIGVPYNLPPLDLNTGWFFFIMPYFFIGATAYAYREKIIVNLPLAFLAVVLLLVGVITKHVYIVSLLTIPYLILALAFVETKRVSRLHEFGDLSYGIYLFAFPIQQTIMAVSGNSLNPLNITIYAVPVLLLIAWLSWRFVEKPSLAKKTRFSKTRYPVL